VEAAHGIFRRRNPHGRLPIWLIDEGFQTRMLSGYREGLWGGGEMKNGGGRFLPPPKVLHADR